jgi:DNA mismatch endonuclease (patch repair protein)
VLPKHQAVIFVHGCFWHQHPDPACRLARRPKTRLDFWLTKFATNQARDLRTISALELLGWRVLVVWQCELRDKEQLENKLRGFLADR